MLAIGNGELDNNGDVGETIYCDKCKTNHDIKYGTKRVNGVDVPSKLLAFYNCKGKTYLAGVDGKLLK